LVADGTMRATVEGILSRSKALNIRDVDYVVRVPPQNDPGVRRSASDFLRTFVNRFEYAIVMFDREGCGREESSRTELENQIEQDLLRNGWRNNAVAVVLDPELESWVWSDSPKVDEQVGWTNRQPKLRDWLQQQNLVQPGVVKPNRPKEALEAALKETKTARTSAIYKKLATTVGFSRCTDPAFEKFKTTLQKWFPDP